MITYSGRSVWPAWTEQDGEPVDIGPSIEDIAVGLGRQSRFAGQTKQFYTVLCHSLVSVDVARRLMPDRRVLYLHLLLHDAHESVLSDTPTTWKHVFTRIDERDIDYRIAREYRLPSMDEDDRADLKIVDAACLAAEAHALGHAQADRWWPREDFGSIESLAFELTIRQLQAGNPIRFLEPRNSIPAMQRILKELR